ncbi:MAG: S8 family peptidase [Bacillota bacterium]|nr:S8 family peptidase [Bacillota bacterium]
MLEIVGTVERFMSAVRRIPGMEWLAEVEIDPINPSDDFFALNDQQDAKETKLRARAFLVLTNQQALREMLRLWQIWQQSGQLPWGQRRWGQVFGRLHLIRRWGIQDRLLETGVLEDWRERIEAGDTSPVPCEIELWYRDSPRHRALAEAELRELVTELDGQLTSQCTIPEIRYHAFSAQIPVSAAGAVLQHQEVDLIAYEGVQYIRAAGQLAGIPIEPDAQDPTPPIGVEPPDPPLRPNPVVALLDGMPLQNHRLLRGRLIIDDPDDWETYYQPGERIHGTAMASLITLGELDGDKSPLQSPLYVRPILRPDQRDFSPVRYECVPTNQLAVDLVHRAVKRVFEDLGQAFSSIAVINLSIGLRDRQFDGTLSPLARLLDWLAWKYKVLFVVSAGNHCSPRTLGAAAHTLDGFERAVLRWLWDENRNLRLLSPGEAVNVLTVGACHLDRSTPEYVARARDPYMTPMLPCPYSAQGLGYRRAVKPDFLAPGGRGLLQASVDPGEVGFFRVYSGGRAPGHGVASPGGVSGGLAEIRHTRGTSNAAALTSRAAARVAETLDVLRDETQSPMLDSIPLSCWIKTLLAHGASWGEVGQRLEAVLHDVLDSQTTRQQLTKLLGYGIMEPTRVLECTDYRVTAIGGGLLRADEAHIHRYPLPPSISGVQGLRRIIVTLAWITPTNPLAQAWRRADLWFSTPDSSLSVERVGADGRMVGRGTVQHEVLEGDRASLFLDGDAITVQVNCRGDAGALSELVPYSLAITLEIDEDIKIPIYNEIRTRIQVEARVGVPTLV